LTFSLTASNPPFVTKLFGIAKQTDPPPSTMNPLLSVIALLATLRSDLYNKFNAAMEKAKPLEQFEAGSAARGILNEIDWAKERLMRTGEELEASLNNAGKFLSAFEPKSGEAPELAAARFLDTFTKKVSEDAVSAAITAGTVIPSADHENALTAARETAATEAKTTAETEFNAKLAKIELLATRRQEAVTRVGELAAATISDDILAGEEYEAAIAAKEARNATLAEKNITPEARPKFYADLIAKADEATFTAGLELILEAAGGTLAPIAAAAPVAPKTPEKANTPLNAGPEKKKVIC
jgi:hypothetical protein